VTSHHKDHSVPLRMCFSAASRYARRYSLNTERAADFNRLTKPQWSLGRGPLSRRVAQKMPPQPSTTCTDRRKWPSPSNRVASPRTHSANSSVMRVHQVTMTAEISLRQGQRSPGVITRVGSTLARHEPTRISDTQARPRDPGPRRGDSEDKVFRVQDHQQYRGLPFGFMSPSPFRY
jgi:hypothetical protein